MYQNISFKVKRMAQEDLWVEKHGGYKISPNRKSARNHELHALRSFSKAGPVRHACPVKYIEDMKRSGFNRGLPR